LLLLTVEMDPVLLELGNLLFLDAKAHIEMDIIRCVNVQCLKVVIASFCTGKDSTSLGGQGLQTLDSIDIAKPVRMRKRSPMKLWD
jgi:hypothetical protein